MQFLQTPGKSTGLIEAIAMGTMAGLGCAGKANANAGRTRRQMDFRQVRREIVVR